MKLGFVGTGAITSAIVTGLNASDAARDSILVSPRNAEVAAALAAIRLGTAVAVESASNSAPSAWRPRPSCRISPCRRDHGVAGPP